MKKTILISILAYATMLVLDFALYLIGVFAGKSWNPWQWTELTGVILPAFIGLITIVGHGVAFYNIVDYVNNSDER